MSDTKSTRTNALTAASAGADPIDVHIGRRLKARRTLVGLTQAEIATAIGVTFQQVQKYERGANRISGSRLFDVACALQVPVSYFYDGISPELVQARIDRASQVHEAVGSMYMPPEMTAPSVSGSDPMYKTENVELLRDIERLSSEQQQAVRCLVRVMTRRD